MNEVLLLKEMRAVDMSLHRVVKCGVSWPFSFQPNSKNMILQLERNEALVTWLEPLESDDISKQFPAIRVRDQYYTMSLRMMKAVWRHIRLKKNFVNRETIPHVGVKLRIPEVLLVEKMRTQQRFNVMRESAYNRSHKTVVRKRMDEVLHQLILPAVPPPEGITYFTVQEDESLMSIVDQLRRDCPRWCTDKQRLLVKLEVLLG